MKIVLVLLAIVSLNAHANAAAPSRPAKLRTHAVAAPVIAAPPTVKVDESTQILRDGGVTKEMQATVEKYWLFKSVKHHYKSFYVYQASVSDNQPEELRQGGDKTISLTFATYDDSDRNSTEDSISFTIGYDSRDKSIRYMDVNQGPCWSDICGP